VLAVEHPVLAVERVVVGVDAARRGVQLHERVGEVQVVVLAEVDDVVVGPAALLGQAQRGGERGLHRHAGQVDDLAGLAHHGDEVVGDRTVVEEDDPQPAFSAARTRECRARDLEYQCGRPFAFSPP
jgi:hypothetical protein